MAAPWMWPTRRPTNILSLARSQSWRERLSANPFCIPCGERYARAIRQPDRRIPDRRDPAGQSGASAHEKRHALSGRPKLLWFRTMATGAGNRSRSALADEEELAHGLREAPARRFLFEPRVPFGARLAAPKQRYTFAGDRLPPRGYRGIGTDLSAATTILDPGKAPAGELAAFYHERWEIETAFDELKTHLRGAQIVLRSKTPDLVRQEVYGLMMDRENGLEGKS